MISQGWEVEETKPLYIDYAHKSKKDYLKARLSKYGGIFIGEKDWMNNEFDRIFTTVNPNFTESDYFKIMKLLMIKL